MKNDYKIRQIPRTFEEVTKQLIQYITEEELSSGSKLPTERNLSELLGVSRSSIREGLRILELLNYLESRQGGGTFVSEPPPFLIPLNIIKQAADQKELIKYFEIGMIHAEKIVKDALLHHVELSEDFNTDQAFWKGFSTLLHVLGQKIPNDYYLSLWSSIYQLLEAQNFFKHVEAPFSLASLYEAYLTKNDEQIEIFLRELEQALPK